MWASKLFACFELSINNALFLHLSNIEARSRNHCCRGKAVLHKTYLCIKKYMHLCNIPTNAHTIWFNGVHLLVYYINVTYEKF